MSPDDPEDRQRRIDAAVASFKASFEILGVNRDMMHDDAWTRFVQRVLRFTEDLHFRCREKKRVPPPISASDVEEVYKEMTVADLRPKHNSLLIGGSLLGAGLAGGALIEFIKAIHTTDVKLTEERPLWMTLILIGAFVAVLSERRRA